MIIPLSRLIIEFIWKIRVYAVSSPSINVNQSDHALQGVRELKKVCRNPVIHSC